MNILSKLQKARDIIKKQDLKKTGRNDYSKFDYYTPEQVEKLVDIACKETKLICLCNLKADEFGLYQTLMLRDLEEGEEALNSGLLFEMRTKHGEITATNEAQQMGGTDTYSERYIKMKVFQIKDNNLDPDSSSGKPATAPKTTAKEPPAPTQRALSFTDDAVQKLVDKIITPTELTKKFSELKLSLTGDQVLIFSRRQAVISKQ